jgi:hypothetical protein
VGEYNLAAYWIPYGIGLAITLMCERMGETGILGLVPSSMILEIKTQA